MSRATRFPLPASLYPLPSTHIHDIDARDRSEWIGLAAISVSGGIDRRCGEHRDTASIAALGPTPQLPAYGGGKGRCRAPHVHARDRTCAAQDLRQLHLPWFFMGKSLPSGGVSLA